MLRRFSKWLCRWFGHNRADKRIWVNETSCKRCGARLRRTGVRVWEIVK